MQVSVNAYDINHQNLRQLLLHARKTLKLSIADIRFIVESLLREIEEEEKRVSKLW